MCWSRSRASCILWEWKFINLIKLYMIMGGAREVKAQKGNSEDHWEKQQPGLLKHCGRWMWWSLQSSHGCICPHGLTRSVWEVGASVWLLLLQVCTPASGVILGFLWVSQANSWKDKQARKWSEVRKIWEIEGEVVSLEDQSQRDFSCFHHLLLWTCEP